jgi:hypothetical protein
MRERVVDAASLEASEARRKILRYETALSDIVGFRHMALCEMASRRTWAFCDCAQELAALALEPWKSAARR